MMLFIWKSEECVKCCEGMCWEICDMRWINVRVVFKLKYKYRCLRFQIVTNYIYLFQLYKPYNKYNINSYIFQIPTI